MSHTYMVSDLHFGHRRIMEFAGDYRQGDDWYENMHITIALWNSIVTKRDTVYVLGDVCFDKEQLYLLDELKGNKILVRGNHDTGNAEKFLKYFSDVKGLHSYKGYWLSHAPIHPNELRGRKNIHGHVHQNSIRNAYGEVDDRYINVCIENTGGVPVKFHDIKSNIFEGVIK
jgi:calcineurin-like phosphoesterase family protein